MRIALHQRLLLTACCVGISGLGMSGSAQAGFEWTPPVSVQSAPPAPALPPVPPVPVDSAVIPEPPMDAPLAPAPAMAPPSATADMPALTVESAPINLPQKVDAAPPLEKTVAQDPKKAVYPPPGNAAAAPLSGTKTVTSPFKPGEQRGREGRTGDSHPVAVQAPAPQSLPQSLEVVEAPVTLPQTAPGTGVGLAPQPPAMTLAEQMEAQAGSLPVIPPAEGGALPPRGLPDDGMTVAVPDTAAQQPLPEPIPTPPVPVASPAGYAVVEGFGEDIPMDLALKQIIPADYKVVNQAPMNPQETVSWSGGRPWNEVLSDMLAGHGMAAIIGEKTVTLRAVGIPPSAAIPVMAPAPGQPEQTGPMGTMYNPAQIGKFQAMTGESLKNVLTDWSMQANVKVHWTMDGDAVISEPVKLENVTYAQAVGALLDQFKKATPRPVGHLHPNKPNGPAILVIETQAAG